MANVVRTCAVILLLSVVDAFRAPSAGLPIAQGRIATRPQGHFHHSRPTANGVLQLKAYVPGQYGFEAQAPALGPTFAVFISTFGVAAYWWLVLVPSERRDLAKNKNKGGLNEYLDELYYADEGERKLEKWFYSEWLARRERVRKMSKKAKEDNAAGGLATMTKAEQEEMEVSIEREIENAAPTPNFLSLDNPIIIAIALSFLGVILFGGR